MIQEIPSYEELLQNCLDRVPSSFDKRQGSIIYDAIAPCVAELAQMYIALASTYDMVFIDTAVDDSLDALVKQNGIFRNPATKAQRKGEFNLVVPVGSRFSDGTNSYIVLSNIDGTNNSILECEVEGAVGNSYYGPLTPISYITNLTKAELTDITTVGNDMESDEVLRARYVDSVVSPQFGGNISDYKIKTKSVTGVGGVKVIPIWNGGGTVKVIITDSAYGVPTSTLINNVQNVLDPTLNQKGLGLAPIGHMVTVNGVSSTTVTITTSLTLKSGYTATTVQAAVNKVVDDYFIELGKSWEDIGYIIVRISQLDTRLLGVDGVLDVKSTTLNGSTSNLSLGTSNIPKRTTNVSITVLR